MTFFQRFSMEARQTLALAFPIMVGQISQMLVGLVDSAMVGRVGTRPLAASAFALNVSAIFVVFGIGLMMSLSVRVAQARGAQDENAITSALRHGLMLSVLVGAVMSALMIGLSFFLDRFGQSPDVAREARPFFQLIGVSTLPVVVALAVKQFSEAMDHPWPPMLLLLLSVPLTAFFNWLLIPGNWGFPAMGLVGAGWATLLARVISMLLLLTFLFREPRFRAILPRRWRGDWRRAQFASLLIIGLPSAFHLSIEVAAFSMGAIMVGWIGEAPLAAHQIALSCAATTFMLPLGLGMATTIRVGNALGAREWARVRLIGITSALIGTLFMLCTATLFLLAGRAIAGIFVSDSVVVILAAQLLVVAAIFQIFDGLQVTIGGALRGLNDALVPMLLVLVAYWAIGLPVGYWLAFKNGLQARGIWFGFATGLGIVSLMLCARFAAKSRVASLEKTDERFMPATPEAV